MYAEPYTCDASVGGSPTAIRCRNLLPVRLSLMLGGLPPDSLRSREKVDADNAPLVHLPSASTVVDNGVAGCRRL
jgi:hypothetical protein